MMKSVNGRKLNISSNVLFDQRVVYIEKIYMYMRKSEWMIKYMGDDLFNKWGS